MLTLLYWVLHSGYYLFRMSAGHSLVIIFFLKITSLTSNDLNCELNRDTAHDSHLKFLNETCVQRTVSLNDNKFMIK